MGIGSIFRKGVNTLQKAPQQGLNAASSGVQGAFKQPTPTTPISPAAPPPSPPPVAPLTAYQKMVADRLGGQDQVVQSAQGHQDTNSSLRNYAAMRGARQQSANAGFTPGTLQSQRVADRSTAEANSANLQGQNNVNELARGRNEEAMGLSHGLDQEKYQKGQALGSSLASQKAKQAYNMMVATGIDPQQAYASLVDSTGTLKAEYQEEDPTTTEYNAFLASAQKAGMSEAEAIAAYGQNFRAGIKPISTADKTTRIEDLKTKAPSEVDWAGADADLLGTIPQVDTNQFAGSASKMRNFVNENLNGYAKLNGKPYKILGTEKVGGLDVLKVEDASGVKYLKSNGEEWSEELANAQGAWLLQPRLAMQRNLALTGRVGR